MYKAVDITLTIPGNANWNQKFNIAATVAKPNVSLLVVTPFRWGVPGIGNVNGKFTLERGAKLLVIPIYQDFS